MIRRHLQNFINWVMRARYDNEPQRDRSLPVCTDSSSIGANGMNFTLYSASGGYIVEYRTYDKKNDERINNLHIITNDQDIGERIGQIVTTELLRNY